MPTTPANHSLVQSIAAAFLRHSSEAVYAHVHYGDDGWLLIACGSKKCWTYWLPDKWQFLTDIVKNSDDRRIFVEKIQYYKLRPNDEMRQFNSSTDVEHDALIQPDYKAGIN